ncbi:PAS domain-containing sensor histidine kinase [Roseospira marina]|nr:PAS domain S-box protein [Roseospira marina]MBB4316071.1 two-component system cell cycle sensor histidine kinase PleC [Roseospira marina]MBB5089211.1 two-component system cell cycle sensor histidine kinase PleC [Roseospira marina]
MSPLDVIASESARFVEAAPVAILVLDLTELWAFLQPLRREGESDLGARLDAGSGALASIPDRVGFGLCNARARSLLGVGRSDVDTGVLVRRFLGRRRHAALVRAGLLALWRGDGVFEGVARVRVGGSRRTLALTVSLPASRGEARSVFVFLEDRTPARPSPPAQGPSDDLFHLTFERASHGMALLDRAGRWLRVNQALCTMLGYTAEELVQLDCRAVTHPDDADTEPARFGDMMSGPDQTRAREKRLLRKDGTIVWARVSGAFIAPGRHGGGGDSMPADGVVVVHVQDIHTRKAAEAALIQSEARFRQSFENAGHGMALVTIDGHILTANPMFCETVGYPLDEILGAGIDDLTPEPERARERALRQRLIDDGGNAYAMEKRVRHASGEVLWVRGSVTVVRTAANIPIYFIYQFLNVTDHYRTLARALAAESQLLGAIETIEDGVLMFDTADRLVLANSRYRAWMPELAGVLTPGTSIQTIIAASVDKALIVPPEGSSLADWARWRLDIHHRVDVPPFETRVRDGRYFLVRQGRAEDGSTLVLLSDITELKARQTALAVAKREAETANRAKSEFLANMSHELRTPLNAIIGFSEMVLDEVHGPLGAPAYGDYLNSILASGRHLLAVVSDILELSRVEAGALQLNESLESLEGLVGEALNRFAPESQKRRIGMTMLVRPSLPWLRCDPIRIRQCVDNLISNALKFTHPNGSVVVQARLARSGQLVLSVSDDGIGMSAEDIRVALSNFGQVQGVFTRAEGGTGLGLPLCRALVEAHGGTLEIISQPGAGVTVMIRFPAHRVVLRSDVDARVSETATDPGADQGQG